MMDRYDNEEFELSIKERSGWKFINLSKEIYLQLARLQESKKIKLDQQFQMIVPAVDLLVQLWETEEKGHSKFKIPNTLRDDYFFSKKRYLGMKGNPDSFYKEDTDKRSNLEKEKITLADKIKSYEVEFAREEDDRRYEANNERIRITSELAVLNYQKKKYESKSAKNQSGCFPSRKKTLIAKLAETNLKIKDLEAELKKIGVQQYKAIEDKRYQLELLHKRRWDVDKALHAHDGSAATRVNRWQNAIDNAEIVMIVRRMDINDAVNRHYSSVSTQTIHALLNVYALIRNCIAQSEDIAPIFGDDVAVLSAHAEMLYCPEIANRSVATLFKKMQILRAEDRQQVIHDKPARGRLPEALVKTFSVKNLKDTVSSLGLYRKVLPPVTQREDELMEVVNVAGANHANAGAKK